MKLVDIIVVLFVVLCTFELGLGGIIALGQNKRSRNSAAAICKRQCFPFAGKKVSILFEPETNECFCKDEFGNGFGFVVVTRD